MKLYGIEVEGYGGEYSTLVMAARDKSEHDGQEFWVYCYNGFNLWKNRKARDNAFKRFKREAKASLPCSVFSRTTIRKVSYEVE